jgi:truncated hemoglobin YjbI
MVRRRRGDHDPTLSGRIGAFRLHALHDPRETTRNARAAFLDSFERAVDPHGLLPEDERRRRAAYAKKAHFAKLARLSALARRTRRRQG